MILFFFGDDSRLTWSKVAQIKAKFISTHPDGEVSEWTPSTNALSISGLFLEQSLWSPKKLILLRDVFSQTDATQRQELVDLLSADTPENITVVVWESDKVDKRQKLFKLLNQPGKAQECRIGSSPDQYVRTLMQEYGVAPSDGLTSRLVAGYSHDTWKLHSELQKISSAPAPELIDELLSPEEELASFALQDAVSRQSTKQALVALARHFRGRDESPIIIGGLAGVLRNLVTISSQAQVSQSSSVIAKNTGLHPFVVSKLLHLASSKPTDYWIARLCDLSVLDHQTKTGITDSEAGIHWMVTRVTT